MAWFSRIPLLIPDVIALNAVSLNSKDAVVFEGNAVDWAAFGAGTARVANALLASGLDHGDRVVVLMTNGYEMVEAMFGIIRAGLCAVPLNCAITDDAVKGMIENSAAKAVVASGEHMARIEAMRERLSKDARERLIGVKVAYPGWHEYREFRDRADPDLADVAIAPGDECNVIYSSGTTGLPKGIVHDHACREAWGSDMAVALRYHSGARTLVNLGLFSNISWVAMLATFFAGGTLVIQRRFDVHGTLDIIQKEKITHTVMVPLQFQKLLECAQYDEYDLSSLDAYMCCGSPLAVDLKKAIARHMPGQFIELYGLTEGLVTILGPEDMPDKIGSVGRACPGQHLAILDDDDNILPAGETGEIVGHSRFLMAGYHANDGANEEAEWMHPSGAQWLRTGDVGLIDDDGFLFLVDRKKDMIISGGQNIYPADIEATIVTHDAVAEVAVIGVADDKWGETPLAVVVLADDASIDNAELTAWANGKLGKQQRVSGTVFIDELPRNPNGKVLKRILREQFRDVSLSRQHEVADVAPAQYFQSHDGLNIFYRDFGVQNDGTPVICLPGLTRNSRDFEDLAERLRNRRRVLTIDFRGRGSSDHDPNWQNYHPATYVADVWRLLDLLAIDKVIVVGTSLGGLCAMVMAEEHGDRVAGVVMNDVGPEINPAGLARVQEYTGRIGPVSSWDEAAQQTRNIYGEWLPGLSDDDFMMMAKRAYREDDCGTPRLDIDNNIGRAVREVGPQKGDPWGRFAALRDIPVTLLWGVMSDILTKDIVDRMQSAKPDLDVAAVPNRGHVPLLDEPECLDAIDRFLKRVP